MLAIILAGCGEKKEVQQVSRITWSDTVDDIKPVRDPETVYVRMIEIKGKGGTLPSYQRKDTSIHVETINQTGGQTAIEINNVYN